MGSGIPSFARWVIVFCVLVAVVVCGGAEAIDLHAEDQVKRAASDIGIDLTARDTRFEILNLANDDGYRGADLKLFDVTMRFRGTSAVLHSNLVELRFGSISRPRDLDAFVHVEIQSPTIEVDGDLKQLVANARDFKERADIARRKGGGAPIGIAFRDASVRVRGAAGPKTEADFRSKFFFTDVGEPPTRGYDDDRGGGYGGSTGEADVTWHMNGRQEGPIKLQVEHSSRGEDPNRELRYDLTVFCETRIILRLADGYDPTFSSMSPIDGGVCPMTLDVLRSFGARETPPHP
jgi:hypothetical protein